MKIALNRSNPRFWFLYFAGHFSFLLVILFLVRWLWSLIVQEQLVLDLGEMAFESLVYAFLITTVKIIRYIISKKQYEKNPVDRRKNRMFRE